MQSRCCLMMVWYSSKYWIPCTIIEQHPVLPLLNTLYYCYWLFYCYWSAGSTIIDQPVLVLLISLYYCYWSACTTSICQPVLLLFISLYNCYLTACTTGIYHPVLLTHCTYNIPRFADDMRSLLFCFSFTKHVHWGSCLVGEAGEDLEPNRRPFL